MMCSRKICTHRTDDPKTAGWIYMDQAPAEFPHWVGWWCPACIVELNQLMAEAGVKVTVERLM